MSDAHAFYHGIEDGDFDHMPLEWWENTKAYLDMTAIERYEKPSRCPAIEPLDPDGVIDWKHGSNPKQLAFQKAFFARVGKEHRHPTVYAAGGANRSGKTVTTWGLCFCKYLRDVAKNGDLFWAMAPTFPKLKQGPHKWLWDYLPHSMFPDNRQYKEENGFGDNPILELKLPGGRGKCTVVFHTEDQDWQQYESDMLTGIVWTEAGRELLMRPCLMRTSDKAGFLLIDYLPTEPWHKIRLENDPDAYYMHYCMMDNCHNMPPGTIAKKKKELSKEEFDLSVLGLNRAGFGAVYKQFIPEIEPEGNLCKPFPVPDYWPIYLSGDWGYRNPHSIQFGTLSPDEEIYIFDEQYDSEMTVPAVCTAIVDKLWSYRPCGFPTPPVTRNDRRRFMKACTASPLIIDPATFQTPQGGGDSIATQFDKNGVPVQKGAHTHLMGEAAMVEIVRRRFENRKLIFFDTCVYTISDHSSWRYKQDKNWNPDPNDKFEDANNHACDSVRYLVCFNPMHNTPKGDVYSPEGD